MKGNEREEGKEGKVKCWKKGWKDIRRMEKGYNGETGKVRGGVDQVGRKEGEGQEN